MKPKVKEVTISKTVKYPMMDDSGEAIPFTNEEVTFSATLSIEDEEPDYYKVWEQVKKQIDVGFSPDKADWLMETHGDITIGKALGKEKKTK